MHVWLNGRLVEPAEAKLSIDDHGLIVGDGAFETMKTVRGAPFALSRHLRRLESSLIALGIAVPDHGVLQDAVHDTIAAAGHEHSRVRLTVTAGSGSLGTGMPGGTPSVFVAVTELAPRPASVAITVPWTRNENGATAGIKSTSYAENVRALRVAHEAGAGEAIMANTRGELCEGTGTNVFVVIDGQVLTPPLGSGCLGGITREVLLELVEITEQVVPMEALHHADEVFLSSSTRDVQGLERLDGRELCVGPKTIEAADAFASLVATTTDP